MSNGDGFDAQPEALRRVLIHLESLRNADATLHGERPNWLAERRLAVYANCCRDRMPLVEVMNTDPPCVLLAQASVSQSAVERSSEDNPDRPRWQGIGQARGNQGFLWLSTFEQMAKHGGKQWLWCRHQRWWMDPKAVVSLRGEHFNVLRDDMTGRER